MRAIHVKKKLLAVIVLVMVASLSTAGCVNFTTKPTAPLPNDPNYTQKALDYFSAVVGVEYGSNDTRLAKWNDNIRIKIIGSPTEEDLRMINYTLSELNNDLNGTTMSIDSNNPNMEIYFVPTSDFSKYLSNYVPGNEGFSSVRWNSTNKAIYKSTIALSTNSLQISRSHIIIHEITHSLGLGKDSGMYSDSVFNELPNHTTKYAQIDETVVKMLYQKSLKSGMSKEEALQVLSQHQIN
jgi:hypothetical protein